MVSIFRRWLNRRMTQYLAANKGDSGLTKELSSLVRQQRHLGMRVIISTQGTRLTVWAVQTCLTPLIEPTVVPPVLLDLCSVAILHRFSSPSWLSHVEKHVAARMATDEAFDEVVRLQVSWPTATFACCIRAEHTLGRLYRRAKRSCLPHLP